MAQVHEMRWVYFQLPGEDGRYAIAAVGNEADVAGWIRVGIMLHEDEARRVCDAHNGRQVAVTE